MNIRHLSLLCLLSPLMACATSTTSRTNEEGVPDLPPYDGPRARIAVREFEWKVGSEGGADFAYEAVGSDGQRHTVTWSASTHRSYAGGLTDMLTRSLAASDRYVVLERNQFSDTREEVGMAEEGWMAEGSGPRKGNVIGADIGIYGAVTAFEPDAGGSSVGGGIMSWIARRFGFGSARFNKKRALCSIEMRIYDLNTSVVLKTVSVIGESESSSWSVGGFGLAGDLAAAGGGVFSEYENTPMDSAIRMAIAKAVQEIVKETPGRYMAYGADGLAWAGEDSAEMKADSDEAEPASIVGRR